MMVFSWKTLKKGELVGMIGRVYLVRWEGETSLTLCLRDEFDIPVVKV
jgi:hypothetical protein